MSIGERNAVIVVPKDSGWASDGRANSGKELAKKHDFLREGSEGHVLGLGSGENDTLLNFVAPRDMTTGRHINEASAGTAVNAIGKGGVLPYEELCRDRISKDEAVLPIAKDVTENAFSLIPRTRSRRVHKPAQEAHNN